MRAVSLKTMLLRVALLLVAVILAAAIAAGVFAYNNANSLVISSVQDLSELQMRQMDAALTGMDAFLSGMSTQNYELSTLVFSTDDNERYKVLRNTAIEISRAVSQYPQFSGVFVAVDRGGALDYVAADGLSAGGSDQLLMKELLTEMIRGQDAFLESSLWQHTDLRGTAYLLKVFARGSIYCGAWVKVDALLDDIRQASLIEQGAALLLDYDGLPLGGGENMRFSTGTSPGSVRWQGASYVQINRHSTSAPYVLALLYGQSGIFRLTLPVVQVFVLFAVLLLAVFAFVVVMLRKRLYAPINAFSQTMSRFGETGEPVPAAEDAGFEEIRRLSATYNMMTDQITRLKIDAYEQMLARQDVHLKYLKTQIQPHFFMNALNVIYSFAQVQEYRHIQNMSLCLVEYFRYILSDTDVVRLRQELEHARNYISIQDYRFPGNFLYEEDVPGELLDLPVPVLVVQTFLENSVKYALAIDEQNSIRVRAAKNGGRLEITILDSGPGFSPEVLAVLQAGGSLDESGGGNVGINNIRQRMAILYGEQADFFFENQEGGGACIRVAFPAQAAGQEGQL